MSGITKATAIAAGPTGSCAVISDGTVECWGKNGDPPSGLQLSSPLTGSEAIESPPGSKQTTTGTMSPNVAPSTVTESRTPVPVSGIANATAVTVGVQFECALLSSGGIDCWGDGAQGQLGDGTTESSSTPVAVHGISNAIAVTAGREYACALLSGGSVECWGEPPNRNGIITTPEPVSGLSNVVAIADAGYYHICAVLSSGGDECWGANENGQLGNGTYQYSYTPVAVQGLSGPAAKPGGSVVSSCAQLSAGSVECWGANEGGELGNGTTNASLTPVPVSGITTATGIAGGEYTGCARLSGNSIECWGAGGSGQLGNGTYQNSLVPVPVSGIG